MLRDGKPVLAVSVAGGDLQDQTTLQLLVDAIDFGLSPAETVTAPRFATNHLVGSFRQTPPQLGSLLLAGDFGEDTIRSLRARGHKVTVRRVPLSAPTVLSIDPESRVLRVAGHPKAGRHAAAY